MTLKYLDRVGFPRPQRGWTIAVLGAIGLTGLPVGLATREAPREAAPGEPPPVVENLFAPQRQVLNQSELLGIPFKMTTVGSHLVVNDLAADVAFHVIDRHSGELTRGFGREGEGPGEFKSVWSLDPLAGSSSELWVYDYTLRRLSYVDLRDEFFEQERLGERSVNLLQGGLLTGVIQTDQGQFVSPGFFPGGRLGVFDGSGKFIDYRGEIPAVDRDLPPMVRQYMFQATAAARPDHSLLAVASRFASRLEIYTSDGSLVTTGRSPAQVAPDAQRVVEQGEFRETDETRFGYVDVAASDDFVFALYSGRSAADFEGREFFSQQVHVFEWDGEYRGAVQLEVDATSLAVDKNSQTLYVVEWEPVPAISEYSLAEFGAPQPR
jgi:hypothetical protein